MLRLGLLGLLSSLVRLSLSMRLGLLQHLLMKHLLLHRILALRRPVRHRHGHRLSARSWSGRAPGLGDASSLYTVGGNHRSALIVLELLAVLDSEAALRFKVSLC